MSLLLPAFVSPLATHSTLTTLWLLGGLSGATVSILVCASHPLGTFMMSRGHDCDSLNLGHRETEAQGGCGAARLEMCCWTPGPLLRPCPVRCRLASTVEAAGSLEAECAMAAPRHSRASVTPAPSHPAHLPRLALPLTQPPQACMVLLGGLSTHRQGCPWGQGCHVAAP